MQDMCWKQDQKKFALEKEKDKTFKLNISIFSHPTVEKEKHANKELIESICCLL